MRITQYSYRVLTGCLPLPAVPYNLWVTDNGITKKGIGNGYEIGITFPRNKTRGALVSELYGSLANDRSYYGYGSQTDFANTYLSPPFYTFDCAGTAVYYANYAWREQYIDPNNPGWNIDNPADYVSCNWTIPPDYFNQHERIYRFGGGYFFLVGDCGCRLYLHFALTEEEASDPTFVAKIAELSRKTAFAIAEDIIKQGKELELGGAWLVTPEPDSPYYVAPNTTPAPWDLSKP